MRYRPGSGPRSITMAVLTMLAVWTVTSFAAVGGAGGGGSSAGAVVSRETRTLVSSALRLSVSLEARTDGVRFVLDSVTDPVTGIVLDTSASPIWQVMVAGTQTPPPGVSFPSGDALADGSVVVPEGHAAWGPSEPGALELRWTGLETPGGQTLDVTVSVRLRGSDGFAEWSLSAQLSDGPDMLVSAAFPLLDLPGIGDDPSDDVLFHPTMGGSVVRDPVGCGRFLPEFSSITHDPEPVLLYPGEVASAFQAADGTIELFAANPTRTRRTFTLSFDPADYGIASGASWRLSRLDSAGHGTVVGRVRGGSVYTSPELALDPLSVLVLALRPVAPAPRRPTGRVLP